MTTTKIYLAVISRIHAIQGDAAGSNVSVQIAPENGDSSKHILARVLPEMKWMSGVPASILVGHAGTKPSDDEVRTAIRTANVIPAPPPVPVSAAPAPAPLPGFGLGENVFKPSPGPGPDPKPSKWTDSGWKEELTVAGEPDDSDYVAAFQITLGGPDLVYYQSILYSSLLLRIDYLLVAQQASIPA
jgi:hypothetical protein